MKYGIVFIIIAGIITSTSALIQTASAPTSASFPTISVEPSYLKVSPGETFTVNITINPEGEEIYGAQYDLFFDPNLLNATAQTPGTFLSHDGVHTIVMPNRFNNTIGKLEYGESRTVVDYGVTEPGVLATISFEAVKGRVGISDLNLSNVTLISAPELTEIQNISVNHGMVKIESPFDFDTGTSKNPYPSISGVHNGTITPNQTITVSTLYTYPCKGTGGHTEYVRIWNSNLNLNVTARWGGYTGDWHNITFDTPFTLHPNITYNYTIKTGSYPQIIHKKEFNTTRGNITCKGFTDTNGKTYTNWIPAIRLFYQK